MAKTLCVYILAPEDYHVVEYIFDVQSLVWVERYNDLGDFILRLPYKYHYWEVCQPLYYVSIDDSDRLMVIENIELGGDENGQYIELSGRSIELYLTFRAKLGYFIKSYSPKSGGGWINLLPTKDRSTYVQSGNMPPPHKWMILKDQGVESGLIYNMTGYICWDHPPGWNASGTGNDDWFGSCPRLARAYFLPSTDPAITNVMGEWNGDPTDNLYDMVSTVTKFYGWGYRFFLNRENSNIYFQFYAGRNLTEGQYGVIPVVFSNDYQNLISSKVYKTYEKAATWVKTYMPWNIERNKELPYPVPDPTKTYCPSASSSGSSSYWLGDPNYLKGWGYRYREVAAEVRDDGIGEATDEWYKNDFVGLPETPSEEEQLLWRADEMAAIQQAFRDHGAETIFEAEVDPNGYFKYGQDYTLGDLVTIRTDYGVTAVARVTEVTRAWGAEGVQISPVFEIQSFGVADPSSTQLSEKEET